MRLDRKPYVTNGRSIQVLAIDKVSIIKIWDVLVGKFSEVWRFKKAARQRVFNYATITLGLALPSITCKDTPAAIGRVSGYFSIGMFPAHVVVAIDIGFFIPTLTLPFKSLFNYWRYNMIWSTPTFTDLRFGFEITLYIANR